MSLRQHIEQQLRSLLGAAMPSIAQARDSSGRELRLELTAVDRLACAFTELSLFVPHLQSAPFSVLEAWAKALSQKVTYLLESIGPLELDPAAGQLLMRSTPPQTGPQGTQFYELVLSTAGAGQFRLRRYASTPGAAGRTPAEIQLTQEVLLRLVDDIVATCPTTP